MEGTRTVSGDLGAVLRAFGLSRGIFVAHALQERVGENADPWPDVEFRIPRSGCGIAEGATY